jgi:anti-sigma factor RsiW
MSTDASRRNVGAYVLGILDPEEMSTFEAHLAGCDACAREVERLLPTALALGDVSPNQAIALHMIHDESPHADLPALDEPGRPIRERRSPVVRAAGPTGLPFVPRRSGAGDVASSSRHAWATVRQAVARTTALHRKQPATPRHGQASPPRPPGPRQPAGPTNRVGLLGGVAALVVLLIFLIGTQLAGGGPRAAQGGTTSAPAPAAAAGPPTSVDTVHGRQFDVTNPVSGVHAVMSVADASWGSQISLILGGVRGPLLCELVAVGTDGTTNVVASWNVHAPGYGIPEEPEPLLLQAATAMALRDIREFRIRGVALDGLRSTLVTLTV